MDKLTAIKKHRKYPFSAYREDEEQYLMSQVYWLELFKSVLLETKKHWEAWLAPSTDRDGSSIFSAVCFQLGKGVIINQYFPTAEDVPYDQGGNYHPFIAWMDVLDDGQGTVIEHLTLNSEISGHCEALCLKLLRMYVVENRSRKEMEEEIRSLEDKLYGPLQAEP
ncbi:hypothetical protein [Archangium sp.]|uniref:hypothetical protein n=1 Tax=Archangium sp. TaxID=1872627 RepID=UPI002D4F65B9|nr:hypothetical protein [Archangium sp.]HYO55753.1 hypothetical protein [Archangium sp.]